MEAAPPPRRHIFVQNSERKRRSDNVVDVSISAPGVFSFCFRPSVNVGYWCGVFLCTDFCCLRFCCSERKRQFCNLRQSKEPLRCLRTGVLAQEGGGALTVRVTRAHREDRLGGERDGNLGDGGPCGARPPRPTRRDTPPAFPPNPLARLLGGGGTHRAKTVKRLGTLFIK